MVKILRMVRKAGALTPEQFKRQWLSSHAPFQRQLLESKPIDRILVSFATGEMLGGDRTPFDAMVELYFADMRDLLAIVSSLRSDAAKRSEANFLDLAAELPFLVAEEHAMAHNAAWENAAASRQPRTKVVRTIRRRKDFTLGQFKDYWLNQHAKLEKGRTQTTRVKKIVATFPTARLTGVEDPDPPFDGMVSLYFDDPDSARQQFAGGSPSVMRNDEANFVDMTVEPVRSITEEYVMA